MRPGAGELANRDRLIARIGDHLDAHAEALTAAIARRGAARDEAVRDVVRALRGMGRELRWLGTGELDAPKRKRLDLVAVVRRVAKLWSDRRPGAAPVVVEAGPRRLVDRWDESHVGAILGELLSNAFKHGGLEPITVGVRGDSRGLVTITVENAGGHALPRRPFLRFVRGPRSRGEGMGVGLWLVDAIAKQNGGRLRFVRTSGGGVKAVVHLAGPGVVARSGARLPRR